MHQKNYGCENLSRRLEKYVEEISLGSGCEVDTDHMYEHIHECQGVNWPAILPPEIVLAGRVLIKSVMKRGCSDVVNTGEMLVYLETEFYGINILVWSIRTHLKMHWQLTAYIAFL